MPIDLVKSNGVDMAKYRTLRSGEIQEIISKKPGFVGRWALFIFLGVLLLLLSATWFIQYPDIIEAKATLAAYNAPKEIIPQKEGRLIKLFVHNDEELKEKQIIGFIESTANHTEVLDLSKRLDSSLYLLNNEKLAAASLLFVKRFENLGELQNVYREFSIALQQYDDYLVNGFYSTKKSLLLKDIASLHQKTAIINSQKQLTEEEMVLAQESFDMNKYLADEKVISKEDFRIEKGKLLNKQMTLPQIEGTILSNKDLQREKTKEIFQLDHDIAQQKFLFQQALQTLKSAVNEWMRNYVISAPVAGKVSFITPVQENKFLQQGKVVGYITPSNSQYYAETNLPQANFGKVDTGQQVQLRFEAYPYQEFGSIEGRLNYISKIPSDSGFLATIQLSNGLITNHQKELHYRNGLKANAIVITRSARLLQRLYYNLVKNTSMNK